MQHPTTTRKKRKILHFVEAKAPKDSEMIMAMWVRVKPKTMKSGCSCCSTVAAVNALMKVGGSKLCRLLQVFVSQAAGLTYAPRTQDPQSSKTDRPLFVETEMPQDLQPENLPKTSS